MAGLRRATMHSANALMLTLLFAAACTAQGPATEAVPGLPAATGAVPPPVNATQAPVTETTGSPDAPLTTQPAVGAAIPVSTTLTAPAAAVVLIWRVDFKPETRVAFDQPVGATKLTAAVPAGVTKAGSLVRWAIEVTSAGGAVSREPAPKKDSSTAYWGTVVPNPDNASPGNLPIMEWYTDQPRDVVTGKGGRCSVFFGNQLYDNVQCGRKGVTSLAWPKPKLKINFHSDNGFKFPGSTLPLLERIDLSSNFREPGQNSYMREVVGYEVMKAAGNPTVDTAWISLNLNNAYYGFFSILSKIDIPYLAHNNLKSDAGVYKAKDGINSNLRWGVPGPNLQYNYQLDGVLEDKFKKNYVLLNSTAAGTPYGDMQDFILGINGGSAATRSNYAFDHLNLPAVVNEMAVQTALLSQDRCTKNYYLYRDPDTDVWQRLPYDLKAAFATDRGFNGQPAKDYCVLACAQWNSPLYCSGPENAQDLSNTTPWSVITPQFGTFSGRRLLQAPLPKLTAPRPINASIDTDLTATPPISGANGTFNYLIKLIVDEPATRAMYFRRLRSIMDAYLNGFVEERFTDNYNLIAADAAKDNAKWNGGDPALGFKQMLQETLPLRKRQLYSMYGPGGSPALIPAEQGTVVIRPGASGGTADEAFLELTNPLAVAVDVSGFKMEGAAQFTFAPGTVIPPSGSVFVVANIAAFRNRSATPTGSQGHFMVGPATGDLTGVVSISTQDGVAVPSTPLVADSAAP